MQRIKYFVANLSKARWIALSIASTALLLWSTVTLWHQPIARPLTQADIDAAVLHTLVNKDLPSRSARAAAIIAPSVVHVRTINEDDDKQLQDKKASNKKPTDKKATEKKSDQDTDLPKSGVGSGVVISEDGKILTNWHVVQDATKIIVTFADGMQSPAVVVGVQPDNDLAILKAEKLPDDLQPATMGSSGSLQPGDEVVAVGFPFGIGPSVSAGVVSGLNRQFKSEGKTLMRGLIQADAAANPGNSGGPLVNMQGEVVGIVTAILNPSATRTFIGILFAATIESASVGLGIPPF